jgi:MFS transporter, DHA3 family, macrolide efflux protein
MVVFMQAQLPRAFLLIWFGQFVSLLGSGLTDFALGVWIYQRTGSPTQYALSVICLAFPRIFLAPLAGAVVDKHDRRRVMLISDLAAGMLTLAVAALLWLERLEVWHIYLAIAVGSCCNAFQRPAYAAYVGSLLPPAQLGRANGLVSLAQATSSLAAPLLAGVLVSSLGLPVVLLLDMLSFAVAVLALVLARQVTSLPVSEPQASESLWQDMRAGWVYLRTNKAVFALFAFMAAAGFFGITTEVLITPYVLSFAGPGELGLVVAASGAGLLAGGTLLSLWGGPQRLLHGVLAFEFVIGLCTLLIGLNRAPLLLAIIVFIYFAAVALGDGCSRTLIQQIVEPAYQGRMFALRDALSLLSLSGGLLLLAPLAEYVLEPALQSSTPGSGIGLVFVLAGLANGLLALAAPFWPALHRLRSNN